MAVDDRCGHACELVAVVLGVVAQHLERLVGIDRVAGHQDPLRLLDHRPPPEGSCRLWYSVKRCSVMSIALCSSSGVVSTM